jgi:precorrin-6Y C5,15-methyltransferase (decarboxylating)
MWFGAGATLSRWFPETEVTVLPHPGAFSLAAARLGWALQETICLSIHGRPIDVLRLHLYPGARLLVLAEDGASPAGLARLLRAEGLGASRLTVFERLGGPEERRLTAIAADWAERLVDGLNTIAVEVESDAGRSPLGVVPGLPDDAFLHDGQLTKQEIRAATLAALRPWPGALLWDVGAGCGSVAIEWARAGGKAVAIERDPPRRDLIARNTVALGVPDVAIQAGDAPAILADLAERPDAIFVGGGLSRPGLLETCWTTLKPGGRLVANCVTAEGEAILLAWRAEHGGELMRLAVSRLAPVGRFHTWHPMMPVTQFVGIKR